MSAPEPASWREGLRRDWGRIGRWTALKLAVDAWLADRAARTAQQSVTLGAAATKVAVGAVRFGIGDRVSGGLQVAAGIGQSVGAVDVIRKDRGNRDARLEMAGALVQAAAARWPGELDKVLLGVQRQRLERFHEQPSKAAKTTPVGHGRNIAWILHNLRLPDGGPTESYRHVCADLEQRIAATPAQPQVSPERAARAQGIGGPPPDMAAIRAAQGPAAPATRSHLARTRAASQAQARGRGRGRER